MPLLQGFQQLAARQERHLEPTEMLGHLLWSKVWTSCWFPEVFTATFGQLLPWQTFSAVTVITTELPALISEKNGEPGTAYAVLTVRWKIKSSPLIPFPPQADLNCNIQDDTGAFYGVTSQYESSENMTITCSTKVCSFGKQVVEKVEVGAVMGCVPLVISCLSYTQTCVLWPGLWLHCCTVMLQLGTEPQTHSCTKLYKTVLGGEF